MVKSLLPVKSPLLSGEKLEGVQDALKGFQAANGVLWFHQEAGPGVSAELMVGDAFFVGRTAEWLIGGCFIYWHGSNVPNISRYWIMNISSGPDRGYLRLAMSLAAAWQPGIWCRIMLWGLLRTTSMWTEERNTPWVIAGGMQSWSDLAYCLCH